MRCFNKGDVVLKIYVDADACPVVRQVEKVAMKYEIKVTLICDTNHVLHSKYSEVKKIDAGKDAVDFALIGMCKKGDIIVTQDYGVAAMALGKGCHAIHNFGKWYTDENIEELLMVRHLSKKQRRIQGRNYKGPKKKVDDRTVSFYDSLEKMVITYKEDFSINKINEE